MRLIQICRIRSNETSNDRSRRVELCAKMADPDVKRFPRYGLSKSRGQRTMAEDRGKFNWEKAVTPVGSFPVRILSQKSFY